MRRPPSLSSCSGSPPDNRLAVVRANFVIVAMLGLAACDALSPNHAPVIEPVAASGEEDLGALVTFVATDEDGDNLQFSVDQRADASIRIFGVAQIHTDDLTRLEVKCGVTPTRDYYGELAYYPKVSDGTVTTEGEAIITIEPVNDWPYVEDDAIAARVNTPVVIAHSTLLANDWDGDDEGDQRTPLTIIEADSASHGAVLLGTNAITFTPEAEFVGVAQFWYTISDGEHSNPGKVRVLVGGLNDPPDAQDDEVTTFESMLVVETRDLTANDFDAEGESLEVLSVANATHGTVQLSGATITFTPEEPSYFGDASFDYTVSDGVDVDTAHVAVTFAPYR